MQWRRGRRLRSRPQGPGWRSWRRRLWGAWTRCVRRWLWPHARRAAWGHYWRGICRTSWRRRGRQRRRTKGRQEREAEEGSGRERPSPALPQLNPWQQELGGGVMDALQCLIRLLRAPPLLSTEQLLSCQPHRLLAAASALHAALPTQARAVLWLAICGVLFVLPFHEALSSRVRSWLAPPPPPAAAGSCSGDGGEAGDGVECAGCLVEPVWAVVRDGMRVTPEIAAQAAVLMRLAAGDATHVDETACCAGGDLQAGTCNDMLRMQLMRLVLDTDEQPLSAPPGPLPPPLALPPSRALAFPRLRMCSNPRCCNFACECEEYLPLKQCGGCRAVRYCGADCQRAHWREGHRAECKAMAAGEGS